MVYEQVLESVVQISHLKVVAKLSAKTFVMGIKGLKSYLLSLLGDITSWEDNREILVPGVQLCIDGDGWFYYLIASCPSFMPALGGNYSHLEAQIIKELNFFRACGLKVVVFFDGEIRRFKQHTLAQRRDQRDEEWNCFYAYCHNDFATSNGNNSMDFPLPPLCMDVLEGVLQANGVEIHMCEEEADGEIALYVSSVNAEYPVGEERCFAYGRDSDFIAMRDCAYIEFGSLVNRQQGEQQVACATHVWRRAHTCNFLGVTEEQFLDWVLLVGNDYTSQFCRTTDFNVVVPAFCRYSASPAVLSELLIVITEQTSPDRRLAARTSEQSQPPNAISDQRSDNHTTNSNRNGSRSVSSGPLCAASSSAVQQASEQQQQLDFSAPPPDLQDVIEFSLAVYQLEPLDEYPIDPPSAGLVEGDSDSKNLNSSRNSSNSMRISLSSDMKLCMQQWGAEFIGLNQSKYCSRNSNSSSSNSNDEYGNLVTAAAVQFWRELCQQVAQEQEMDYKLDIEPLQLDALEIMLHSLNSEGSPVPAIKGASTSDQAISVAGSPSLSRARWTGRRPTWDDVVAAWIFQKTCRVMSAVVEAENRPTTIAAATATATCSRWFEGEVFHATVRLLRSGDGHPAATAVTTTAPTPTTPTTPTAATAAEIEHAHFMLSSQNAVDADSEKQELQQQFGSNHDAQKLPAETQEGDKEEAAQEKIGKKKHKRGKRVRKKPMESIIGATPCEDSDSDPGLDPVTAASSAASSAASTTTAAVTDVVEVPCTGPSAVHATDDRSGVDAPVWSSLPRPAEPQSRIQKPQLQEQQQQKQQVQQQPVEVLPIEEFRDEILSRIARDRVTVIHGETGCGKSSCVPRFIVEQHRALAVLRALSQGARKGGGRGRREGGGKNASGTGAGANDDSRTEQKQEQQQEQEQGPQSASSGARAACRIFVSQPRRIAVTNLTQRLRSTLGAHTVGLRMGHGVRDEHPDNLVTFVTTGYLVRLMAHSPHQLRRITHLIIDEVHERSVEGDLVCLLARDLLRTHPTLRIVLMSATMHTDLYRTYFAEADDGTFGDMHCLSVGARRFPVEVLHTEDMVETFATLATDYRVEVRKKRIAHQQEEGSDDVNKDYFFKSLIDLSQRITMLTTNPQAFAAVPTALAALQYKAVLHLVRGIAEDGTGVLVFVSGILDITELHQLFETHPRYWVVAIHSEIPYEEQELAFQPAPAGKVKVILATNAAESSITLPDVDVVICLGTHKELGYDPASHRTQLVNAWVSKASATQRAGRTGRVRPGIVFRLYSRKLHDEAFTEHSAAAVHQRPLQDVVLGMWVMLQDAQVREIQYC